MKYMENWKFLNTSKLEYSCGTVALMVLGQFSDICGPQISENWPRAIKGYDSAVSLNIKPKLYLYLTR
jgi:hypothetical protein